MKGTMMNHVTSPISSGLIGRAARQWKRGASLPSMALFHFDVRSELTRSGKLTARLDTSKRKYRCNIGRI